MSDSIKYDNLGIVYESTNSVTLSSESENISVTTENTIEAITVPGNYDIRITANDGSRVFKTVTLNVVAE